MLREAYRLLRQPRSEKTTSLQLRLFVFFALFILAVALAFMLILMATGVLDAGRKEGLAWLENELSHLSESASADFGRLSVQGALFSKQLSVELDDFLQKEGFPPEKLAEHPKALEGLLSEEMAPLLSVLQNNACSGSFLILDATVNPILEGAENSRAGIFLKRTEPNAVNSVSAKIHYLRGSAAVARENGVELLGQWQMEFDVSGADYFARVLNAARENPQLTLSRLYYWSGRTTLKGNSEGGMLLCLPVVAEDGTVCGVCGLEVSSMLFKLRYSPDNSRYPGIFCTLSRLDEGSLDTDAGLVAGNSYLTNSAAGRFETGEGPYDGLTSFTGEDGAQYVGVLRELKLYPTGSALAGGKWAVAVMLPLSDWENAARGNNTLFYAAVSLLLAASLLLAMHISKRSISPVLGALDRIRLEGRAPGERTRIAEIDDLLEYLSAQDEARDALMSELEKTKREAKNAPPEDGEAPPAPDLSAYETFVKSIDTLSAAERAVFNLYLKGCTAKEITELLCLSMNTIKTHNRRIYQKLNVTSRKELMVFVQMMATEKEGRP